MLVRIEDLAEKARLVAADAPMTDVVQIFLSDPAREWLIVVQDRKPVGLLPRAKTMELAVSSKQQALGLLTAGEMIDRSPQRVDAGMAAAQFAHDHQSDDYQRLQAGVFILKDHRFIGILTLPRLLKAVSTENAARARSMRQAAKAPVTPPAEENSAAADTQYLLATLAHEVRTPLSGMMGLAEMLASRTQDVENRDIAETIVRSGDTLDRILKDTLDYVSLESGKLELKPEPSDLTGLVSDLRRLWSAQSARRGLALHVSFTPDGPYRVEVDLGRVRQVANNLISNALKFTSEGSVSVTIGTQMLGEDLMMSVEVADTGRGIRATDRSRFFDAFEKGEALKDAPGWGLGLTISHALARHLGGKLSLADNPAGGSVFTLMIPVKRAAQEPFKAPTTGPRSGQFSPGDVLLVEDHEACAMIAIEALEKAGWTVHHAQSLFTANEILSVQSFQAILTDLHLMDGSALSFIDTTRRHGGPNASVPLLVMTADISDGTRQACLAMGADRALNKPIQGPALVATLADVLMARAASGMSLPQLRGRLAS